METSELFEYFKGQWSDPEKFQHVHSKDKWEKSAPRWEKELKEDPYVIELTSVRIRECRDFLLRNGALKDDFRTIDIGCGPGRFVAEFAKYAGISEGTDFSEGMLSLGEQFCNEKGLTNTRFTAFDFMEGDIAAQGWENAFDLVFASMAPAIKSYNSFYNLVRMSRAFCCNCSCISEEAQSYEVIRDALGSERVGKMWSSKGFYVMENMVRLLGYLPVTQYFHTDTEDSFVPSRERVTKNLRKMLRDEVCEDDVERAYAALMENCEGGVFHDRKKAIFGLILWDVRETLPVE